RHQVGGALQRDRHERAQQRAADRVRTAEPAMAVEHGHHQRRKVERAEPLRAIAGPLAPDPEVAIPADQPLWMALDEPVSRTMPGLRILIFFTVPRFSTSRDKPRHKYSNRSRNSKSTRVNQTHKMVTTPISSTSRHKGRHFRRVSPAVIPATRPSGTAPAQRFAEASYPRGAPRSRARGPAAPGRA